MSFEIYMEAFQNHESFDYEREIVEDIFAPLISERDRDNWKLSAGGVVRIDEAPKVSGFSVGRPPGADAFWDGLLAIMQRTPSVLFWPDEGRTACVADAAVIPRLPPDMLEAVGEPFIVSNGREIIRAIRKR